MIEQSAAELSRALAQIVSSEYLLADPAACAAYAVQGRPPACVVAPGSLDELAAVMRAAREQGAVVVPWGGGTQQNIGNPPARIDLVVRTERLNQVLIHEPDDLTISVGAGTAIGALREYLVPHRQMLPLDPPLPQRATIGGLLATAADSPRRLGYGTLRELLIGITVVEVGGRISRGGGMVVKNVSGFDMMKLYHGSLGTLAIIASANFKLLPLPRAATSLLCSFAHSQAAFAMLEALHATQLVPTAAEYLNRAALAQIGDLPASECALVLRAEGLPAAAERHAREIRDLAVRHGAAEVQVLEGAPEAALWARIADFPQTAALTPEQAVLKLATLPIETEQLIAQLEALAKLHGSQAAIDARALNGVIYARLQPVSGPLERALSSELRGVQWIASSSATLPRWGAPPPGMDLMRRIKNEFDPSGLLNPGRFVAGL